MFKMEYYVIKPTPQCNKETAGNLFSALTEGKTVTENSHIQLLLLFRNKALSHTSCCRPSHHGRVNSRRFEKCSGATDLSVAQVECFKNTGYAVTPGCFPSLIRISERSQRHLTHFTPASVVCFRHSSPGCMFVYPVSKGFAGPALNRPNASSYEGVNHLFVVTRFD